MQISAIVPIRHHSERVSGKNYRTFIDRPLFHHILGSLSEIGIFHQIVIDTDSTTVWEDAERHFPGVTLLERPIHLRADDIPMNDVLINTIQSIDPVDLYLQTHTTNPLLSAKSIKEAVGTFISKYPIYDSLFTVTRLQTRLWDQLTRAVNHHPGILLRTQDLPPIYEENSCMYIFTRDILERNHNRVGNRPLMWEIPRFEASDIDEEIDFRIAEFLYREFVETK